MNLRRILLSGVAVSIVTCSPAYSANCTAPGKEAVDNTLVLDAWRQYYQCIQIEADRLEPSGEPANDIATAAISAGACRPIEKLSIQFTLICYGASNREIVEQRLLSGARDVAITRVASIRAAAKTDINPR